MRMLLLRRHFTPHVAATVAHRNHMLGHLQLLSVRLSVVDLLRVIVDVAAACLMLFLAR